MRNYLQGTLGYINGRDNNPLIPSIAGNGETSWCFSQIKGALDDDVTDADLISCVEFNHDGELLATGDKGGRVVIFQVSKFHTKKESPLIY